MSPFAAPPAQKSDTKRALLIAGLVLICLFLTGSGSFCVVGLVCSVVVVDEQGKTDLVHLEALAKGKRLTDEPGQPLPQRVVPSLDVARLTLALVRGLMLLVRDDFAVSLPKVRIAQKAPVGRWYALPQALAGLLAPVAHSEGDDLARAPTQGQPHPSLVLAPQYERPHLVEFQHVPVTGGLECLRQRRQGPGFF